LGDIINRDRKGTKNDCSTEAKYLKLMKLKGVILVLTLSVQGLLAQTPGKESIKTDTLPYYEIGSYPKKYTAENVVARLIDGLGFRFYWATEGLRSEDLSFKPSSEARTLEETIDHILELSELILKPLKSETIVFSGEELLKYSFEEKRKKILYNLKEASDLLLTGKVKMDNVKIVFKIEGQKSEYPFWNALNGPIEDAVWHTGQIVSFRRTSGNPFNGKADVFSGKIEK
jgi:hypothetical protein